MLWCLTCPSNRITIRIPGELGVRIRNRSRSQGQTESELVREALETYLGRSSKERSAYDLAREAGLIGCVKRAPKDLSTSRRHFRCSSERSARDPSPRW